LDDEHGKRRMYVYNLISFPSAAGTNVHKTRPPPPPPPATPYPPQSAIKYFSIYEVAVEVTAAFSSLDEKMALTR